jgi:hypothetical protein
MQLQRYSGPGMGQKKCRNHPIRWPYVVDPVFMDWSSPFGCRAQEHQGTLSEVSSTNQGVWPDTKRRKLQKISSLESQTSINNYKFLGILGKMKTTDKYVSRYRASKKTDGSSTKEPCFTPENLRYAETASPGSKPSRPPPRLHFGQRCPGPDRTQTGPIWLRLKVSGRTRLILVMTV